MSLDISGDWVIFDNTQTVSYYVRLTDGTFATARTCTALKREDKKKYEEFAEVEYADHYCTWETWTETFEIDGTFILTIPKRGDKFVATTITGSQTWIVEESDYCDFTTRFRMISYQEGQGS